MTPTLLRESGEALYGARWQSELARALDVTDRTVRRWAAGEFSIPEAVSGELRGILKAKSAALAIVRRKLRR